MPDIPIVPPNPAVLTSNTQVAPSAATSAVVTTQLPAGLSVLPAGTILNGFVLNRDGKGNPIIRTAKGDLTIQSDQFLRIGSEVVFRLEKTPKQTRANLLSVDGVAPQTASQVSAEDVSDEVQVHNNPPAPNKTANTNERAPSNPLRPEVRGQVIVPSQNSPLSAGTQLIFTVIKTLLPTPGQQPAAPTNKPPAQPTTQTENVQIVPTDADADTPTTPRTATTSNTPPPTTPLSPAANSYAKLARLTPAYGAPQDAQTAAALPKQGPAIPTLQQLSTQPLAAQVISVDSEGAPLLQTALGTIKMQGSYALPPGTQLTLNVQQLERTERPPTAAPILSQMAQPWTTMQQIIQVVTEDGGDDALQQLLRNVLNVPTLATAAEADAPNLVKQGTEMATKLASFVANLQNGDLRAWLGTRNVNKLIERGQEALLTKAEGEFGAMRSLFQNAQPGQWQPLFMPAWAQGELQMVRLFLKRDRKGSKEERKQDGNTRFVVEVSLSEMGELQLDGFVRKQEDATRFDLFVRTHTPLPEEVQQEIMAIYHNAGELSGFTGSLVIQTGSEFPVNPMDEIAHHAMKDLIL